MNYISKGIYILLCSLLLVGCVEESVREPDLTGYVVDQSNDCILVASVKPKDLSANGGVSKFYDMIWFNEAPTDINRGDKVDIWYDHVDQSYPAVSTLQNYKIHQDSRPNGAMLTQAEALRFVLSEKNTHPSQMFAVQSIRFNANDMNWVIDLFEVWTEDVVSIELSDTNSF